MFKYRISHNIDQLFFKYFKIIPKKESTTWDQFHKSIEKDFKQFKDYENWVVRYTTLDEIFVLGNVRNLFHNMPKHGFIYLLDFKSMIYIEETEFLKSLIHHFVLMVLHYNFENTNNFIQLLSENKVLSPLYAKDVITISFQFLACLEQSICLDNNIELSKTLKKEIRKSIPDLKECSDIRNSFEHYHHTKAITNKDDKVSLWNTRSYWFRMAIKTMLLCLASGRKTWHKYYNNNNIDYLYDLKYSNILSEIKGISLATLSISKDMSTEFIESSINLLISREIKLKSEY